MSKKLSVTEKKIRIRLGKRIKRIEDKLVPPIPWIKSFMAFLAEIVKEARKMCKK